MDNKILTHRNFSSMSSSQRRVELESCLQQSAHFTFQAAQIFLAMEEAGDYTGFIDKLTQKKLRRIAAKEILPEVLHLLDTTSKEVGKLSIKKQKELIDGKKVLVVKSKDIVGNKTIRDMTPTEVRQVFSNGKIRGTAEQLEYIKQKTKKEKLSKKEVSIILDHERKGALINGHFIALGQLQSIVQSLTA
jgi:hypothetical protein